MKGTVFRIYAAVTSYLLGVASPVLEESDKLTRKKKLKCPVSLFKQKKDPVSQDLSVH